MDEAVIKMEAADIAAILKLLPHRYPFLMVDRVIDIRGDEFGIGIKNVTINEPHFCLLYTSPSPRDGLLSRMPSSA